MQTRLRPIIVASRLKIQQSSTSGRLPSPLTFYNNGKLTSQTLKVAAGINVASCGVWPGSRTPGHDACPKLFYFSITAVGNILTLGNYFCRNFVIIMYLWPMLQIQCRCLILSRALSSTEVRNSNIRVGWLLQILWSMFWICTFHC